MNKLSEWWAILSISDIVTLIATIITIFSMVASVCQARKAKSYKEQMLGNLRLIEIINTEKLLSTSIDECRKLQEKLPRGSNAAAIRATIQEKLDNARSKLNDQDNDKDIKELVVSASEVLGQLRESDDVIDQAKVGELHSKLHNARDLCDKKILGLR